jgi:hypothetical protein
MHKLREKVKGILPFRIATKRRSAECKHDKKDGSSISGRGKETIYKARYEPG